MYYSFPKLRLSLNWLELSASGSSSLQRDAAHLSSSNFLCPAHLAVGSDLQPTINDSATEITLHTNRCPPGQDADRGRRPLPHSWTRPPQFAHCSSPSPGRFLCPRRAAVSFLLTDNQARRYSLVTPCSFCFLDIYCSTHSVHRSVDVHLSLCAARRHVQSQRCWSSPPLCVITLTHRLLRVALQHHSRFTGTSLPWVILYVMTSVHAIIDNLINVIRFCIVWEKSGTKKTV